MAAKLLLSHLPISYGTWARIGLFKHGDMDQVDYAYRVFKKHFDLIKPAEGFVSLELGPGDTVACALLSRAFGGSTSYLIDVAEFASSEMEGYRTLAEFLGGEGMIVPDVKDVSSLELLLRACHAQYLTHGLTSLRNIPSGSVDFVYSHSCLEHVRAAEFLDTLRELRRVVRSYGGCSHRVDLQDHLGGSLNNLRFSEQLWESSVMSSSGFYTNRIRFSEMLELFEEAGFGVQVVEVNRWDDLPIPKSALFGKYQRMSTEELCVHGFTAVLKPV